MLFLFLGSALGQPLATAAMEVTTLHGLLEASAARCPKKLCLVYEDHPGLSYEEVWRAVTQCARHLVNLEDQVLALVADRSLGLVISLLGVLRAGKAYTPIEPDFPVARASAMLETADIRHVLVPKEQFPQPLLHDLSVKPLLVDLGGAVCLASGEPLDADRGRLPEVPDHSTAYVLFTSGSTGKPKGCMVPHRGSALYARAVVEHCALDEEMTFLLKTPCVFDVSVQDLFTAFCAGGTLVIAKPGAHKDAGAMAELISTKAVNCACFVPTLLVEFTNYLERSPQEALEVAKCLKRVLTIGEALMTATCKQMFSFIPDLQIHNLYGPTEASVGVSHFAVTKATAERLPTVVPIGRPFDYVTFCVCDPSRYRDEKITEAKLIPAPAGQIGELFIGGDCLATGYMKNMEKTEAAFFHFPAICGRPPLAASPYSLYKTGDLCKVDADGIFHYMGRNDFQVKISGVRIECEEVAAVLKEHPVVADALVTAFEGPYGKALAAYVVTPPAIDWSSSKDPASNDEILNVNSWGAVYDEMYKETENSVSSLDPTLNWSGYTDTYSRRPHIEPVIKEWVEWSCQQVSSQAPLLKESQAAGRTCTITELGCGNGMLLFRLAPLLGSTGRYVGTDISTRALETVNELKRTLPQYQDLRVDTQALAAHEILEVCKPKENDLVLCNGVTMYFPSANYLLKTMQLSAEATRDGGVVIFGDIQSRRHVLPFRCHVETYQALRRQDATALAVLHAAKQSVAQEELSYFDDSLFHQLDRSGRKLFGNRLAKVELRVKRGWWHSEFNRFRYDVWLVLDDGQQAAKPSPKLQQVDYKALCKELQLQERGDGATDLVDARLVEKLEGWVCGRLSGASPEVDGLVVTLPNARTYPATRLLEWLETAAQSNLELRSLPSLLHPADASWGSVEESAKYGVEPEMLFNMKLPDGWVQRVIWDEDPGFIRFVLLREHMASSPWLSAATDAEEEELPEDLSCFKNQPEDVDVVSFDPIKACNDVMKAWAAGTSLLPAMRPAVYIPLESFPKNAAGKIDRAALPDACDALSATLTTAEAEYEPPSTEDEKKMVEIWEKVLKVQVGVQTPFVAYGGHSLTAVQLCSSVFAAFHRRPDLVFLMSEDCTVRALLAKLEAESTTAAHDGCVVRLSGPEQRGLPMLIFTAAGTSAATYSQVAERASRLQLYAVELPGRGQRAEEAPIPHFEKLFENLKADVMRWARKQKRFFAWGDSLGAILAYEFARLWQRDPEAKLLGLFCSGNAGPPEASCERGMGEAVMDHLNLQAECCADMSTEDWKKFLVASAGSSGPELQELLARPELVDSIIGPLRADCMAYESYRLDRVDLIHSPIITLRGGHDVVTSKETIRSWQQVSGSRYEHKDFGHFGHLLARECPNLLAELFEEYSLPDFTHELRHFETFRAAYRLMRSGSTTKRAPSARRIRGASQKEIRKSMRVCSPTLGAAHVPKDFDLGCMEVDLVGLDAIMPPTKEVKLMRVGNLTWRKGASTGNATRLP